RGVGAESLLAHASPCAGCGQLLREAMVPIPAGEIAQRIAEPQPRQQQRVLFRAAAAAFAVIAVVGGFWLSRPRPPLELLAEVYTNHLRFELRIPGARWGSLHVVRGDAQRPREFV